MDSWVTNISQNMHPCHSAATQSPNGELRVELYPSKAASRTVEAGRVSPLITVPGYQSLQVIISLPSSGAPRQPPPSMSSSAGYYAGTNWGTGGEIINEDRTKLRRCKRNFEVPGEHLLWPSPNLSMLNRRLNTIK